MIHVVQLEDDPCSKAFSQSPYARNDVVSFLHHSSAGLLIAESNAIEITAAVPNTNVTSVCKLSTHTQAY